MKRIAALILIMITCFVSISACAAESYSDGENVTISGVDNDARLIIAEYNEGGRLIGCKMYKPENGVITAPDMSDSVSVKTFLWDMNTLEPINVTKTDTPPTVPEGGKTLVAYFSWTNNTEGIANRITEITGADKYEIIPKEPYGDENSDYYNEDTRAYKEQYDSAARPEIDGTVRNMEQYDVIFLGYPIWYGKPPKIIYTFLESYDFTGKTIVPFCTSARAAHGAALLLTGTGRIVIGYNVNHDYDRRKQNEARAH